MHKRFYIGCTHFSHRNIITFRDKEGELIRPFSSVEEMDEEMVANWNAKVRPVDTVVHLGDVCINRKALPILDRLNGRKILIKGNHDIFKLSDYVKYFDDIRACEVKPGAGAILSHVPIHEGSLKVGWFNIHAHIHQNLIPSPQYINICVEHTGYAPVDWDDLNKEMIRRRDALPWELIPKGEQRA
ncbi:MAG: hypothetical protein LC687_04765 [Actinobacteria bacterium]|nr:hypothetical protein [Actinomycetota bacterium]MCA1807146.1 hypothetical protein [Actinomycetota bacterium]